MKKQLYLCLLLWLDINIANAQWTTDSSVNTLVVSAAGAQGWGSLTYRGATKLISDGKGGAIITWQDSRTGTPTVYVQCLDAAGVAQWAVGGKAVSTNPLVAQTDPSLCSDGAGGAIISWYRGGEIHTQRVDSSGTLLWNAAGVVISPPGPLSVTPVLVSDGAGGAIISWTDATDWGEIFAQRINGAGVVQWIAGGINLNSDTSDQQHPLMVEDGAGGAIIAYVQVTSPTGSNNTDIYAQRINASGQLQWDTNGVAVCAAALGQNYPDMAADGAGGVVIAWHDFRNGTTDNDLFAQRINATGATQWTQDGVPISTTVAGFAAIGIVSAGADGWVISWQYSTDIYAQRINLGGVRQWGADGLVVCNASSIQASPDIARTDAVDFIITWEDYRNTTTDVYAQRLDLNGTVQWANNGVVISGAASTQSLPRILSDGSGGAIVAFTDLRNGGGTDIYAQNICSTGMLGGTVPPTPGTISGTTTACKGSSNTYSVTNNPNATSYNWALPGGWSGTSATNTINVTAGSAGGSISVTANNTCGTSAAALLSVTVQTVDTGTAVNGQVITSSQAGATYQWVDCNNGNQPVSGEINQSFTATSGGDYAVIATVGSCSATSACVNILPTALEDKAVAGIQIYPNPASGQFTIATAIAADAIFIMDITGKTFAEIKPAALSMVISLGNFTSGVYLVKIVSESHTDIAMLMVGE